MAGGEVRISPPCSHPHRVRVGNNLLCLQPAGSVSGRARSRRKKVELTANTSATHFHPLLWRAAPCAFPGEVTNEDRYQQQRLLLGFFVNAQSAVESCCFGIYYIGCMRNPTAFSLDERDVNPGAAYSNFVAEYPGSDLTHKLGNLRKDRTWKGIKHIRRILLHRMHPGLTTYMSAVGAPPPPPAEWTGQGVVLQPALVNEPRTWLATAISELVGATLSFVKKYF